MPIGAGLVKKLILKYIGGDPITQAMSVVADYQPVAIKSPAGLLGNLKSALRTINQLTSTANRIVNVVKNPMSVVDGVLDEAVGTALGELDGLVDTQILSAPEFAGIKDAIGDTRMLFSEIQHYTQSVLGEANGILDEFNSIGGNLGVNIPGLDTIMNLERRYQQLTGSSFGEMNKIMAPLEQLSNGQLFQGKVAELTDGLKSGAITALQYKNEMNQIKNGFDSVLRDAYGSYQNLSTSVENLEDDAERSQEVVNRMAALASNPNSAVRGAMARAGALNVTELDDTIRGVPGIKFGSTIAGATGIVNGSKRLMTNNLASTKADIDQGMTGLGAKLNTLVQSGKITLDESNAIYTAASNAQSKFQVLHSTVEDLTTKPQGPTGKPLGGIGQIMDLMDRYKEAAGTTAPQMNTLMEPLKQQTNATNLASLITNVDTLISGGKSVSSVLTDLGGLRDTFDQAVTAADQAYVQLNQAVETHEEAHQMLQTIADNPDSEVIGILKTSGIYDPQNIHDFVYPDGLEQK